MASRPDYIDLGPRTFDPRNTGSPSPGDLPSPRSGEVPPALSPLDAFALQGRLLAQKLEAENSNGKRVSRLPPITIANALAQGRPGYRVPQARTPGKNDSPDTSSNSPAVSEPKLRPKSQYPLVSAFDDAASVSEERLPTIRHVKEADSLPESPFNTNFGGTNKTRPFSPDLSIKSEASNEPSPEQGVKKVSTGDSLRSISSSGLVPPRSPGPWSPKLVKDQSSIRSMRIDSGDDSDSLSGHGNAWDHRLEDRRPPFGGGISRARSPFSPIFAPPRSPSAASDYSLPARASVNFSRPLSRAERPSNEARQSFEESIRGLESPPLRPSTDVLSLHESLMGSPTLPHFPWIDTHTPLNLTDDESSPGIDMSKSPSPRKSSKFFLPRGRAPLKSSTKPNEVGDSSARRGSPYVGAANTISLVNDTRDRRSSETSDSSSLKVITRTASAGDSKPWTKLRTHRSNPSFPPPSVSSISNSSTRTVRPLIGDALPGLDTSFNDRLTSPLARAPHSATTQNTPASADPQLLADALHQLTPDGHLSKGIACHEEGELLKSTYHLRLAARGGNATGMLLYALACRHGWGMRANQEEGVSWLRKAVDHAGLEVAGDETSDDAVTANNLEGTAGTAEKSHTNVLAQRAHKAQLALAIYELGVSYMNGWGIGQDKALALRCFEIAGNWGDGDALAEAGFCYAKGVGCKKDLKRAAEFYRQAEKKGVEMAGNSWIYKDKYMPTPGSDAGNDRKSRSAEKDKDKDKKPRDKSRSRNLFGGKKKQQQAAT